ncbi:hypothetical protein SISSUDRAFT_1054804 [Sistotremastrum suecicum HHB10207 ss-3]|uniref:Uncharacterized protein n=1 Tax=Sistotremastrum suecicum HHB10207 ss-3 TaxID=1314776 RepID=A0A165Y7U6_9AGAM|nr:hypothetical protein SISSUDRAFT_1054804 [Sistotremastrum suecicum HHB10207 ss-3]
MPRSPSSPSPRHQSPHPYYPSPHRSHSHSGIIRPPSNGTPLDPVFDEAHALMAVSQDLLTFDENGASTWPYPVDNENKLVAPDDLDTYCQHHDIEPPRCPCHAKLSTPSPSPSLSPKPSRKPNYRFFKVRGVDKPNYGKIQASCNTCGTVWWFNDYYRNMVGLTLAKYPVSAGLRPGLYTKHHRADLRSDAAEAKLRALRDREAEIASMSSSSSSRDSKAMTVPYALASSSRRSDSSIYSSPISQNPFDITRSDSSTPISSPVSDPTPSDKSKFEFPKKESASDAVYDIFKGAKERGNKIEVMMRPSPHFLEMHKKPVLPVTERYLPGEGYFGHQLRFWDFPDNITSAFTPMSEVPIPANIDILLTNLVFGDGVSVRDLMLILDRCSECDLVMSRVNINTHAPCFTKSNSDSVPSCIGEAKIVDLTAD